MGYILVMSPFVFYRIQNLKGILLTLQNIFSYIFGFHEGEKKSYLNFKVCTGVRYPGEGEISFSKYVHVFREYIDSADQAVYWNSDDCAAA